MISYVYKVKFIKTGQIYIGSRYSKKLTEEKIKNDLWHRYFTSSKLVKSLIKKYGNDMFIPKIIKIFNSRDEAKIYETKLLKRLNANYNPKLLNQSISVFENTPPLRWITDGIIDTMISIYKPIPPEFKLGRSKKFKKNKLESKLKGRIHVIDISTNDRLMIKKEEFNKDIHCQLHNDHNKNRIWCYDPMTFNSKIVKNKKEIPENWIKGNPNRKSTVWYHDPISKINYQIKDEKQVPFNLKKGRFYPFVWYTNPLTGDNVHCKINENPEGYILGRTLGVKRNK